MFDGEMFDKDSELNVLSDEDIDSLLAAKEDDDEVDVIADKSQIPKAHNMDPGEIIKLFRYYTEKARRKGLLAVEEEIENINCPFLKDMLRFVVDGCDPRDVQKIGKQRIRTLMTDILVKYKMALAGFISLQENDNPRILEAKLKSFI